MFFFIALEQLAIIHYTFVYFVPTLDYKILKGRNVLVCQYILSAWHNRQKIKIKKLNELTYSAKTITDGMTSLRRVVGNCRSTHWRCVPRDENVDDDSSVGNVGHKREWDKSGARVNLRGCR